MPNGGMPVFTLIATGWRYRKIFFYKKSTDCTGMEIGTRNLGLSSPKLDTLYQFLSRFLSSILLCTETLNAASQEKFINFKKVFLCTPYACSFYLFYLQRQTKNSPQWNYHRISHDNKTNIASESSITCARRADEHFDIFWDRCAQWRHVVNAANQQRPLVLLVCHVVGDDVTGHAPSRHVTSPGFRRRWRRGRYVTVVLRAPICDVTMT